MAWLRDWLLATVRRRNLPWLALNLGALAIFIYTLTQGRRDWANWPQEGFDAMLESGKWGIRFLLLCLTMTPLHTYLRWSGAVRLRKPTGLWAFAFGAAHFTLYAIETWEPIPVYRLNSTPWHWLEWPMQLYIMLGLVAFCILSVLALTSNKWAMRRLGKRWKQLHRLVYCAGMAIVVHALLASTMSKKMTVLDPQAVPELRLYLGILVVLLTIRIPQVRAALKRAAVARPHRSTQTQPQTRTIEPVTPLPLPKRTPPLQSPTLDFLGRMPVANGTPDALDVRIGPKREQPITPQDAHVRERERAY
jgi:sulfoxide reductase heme-binding subunit YedZ